MAKDSLLAHPNPGDRHQRDLEHVMDVTARALLPVSKLRTCAGCGGRFIGRDLFEVSDDHLTFFEGDELCRSCARSHGIL
jgi:hypothetical protein